MTALRAAQKSLHLCMLQRKGLQAASGMRRTPLNWRYIETASHRLFGGDAWQYVNWGSSQHPCETAQGLPGNTDRGPAETDSQGGGAAEEEEGRRRRRGAAAHKGTPVF